jgi:hypothetical protein
VAWWNKRRNEEREASLVAAMATAFAQALGSVLTAQTEGIKQQGQFLNTLQDLSARKAAQVLGSKGGRTTQKRKKEAKAERRGQECVLCRDPFHRGTTLQQIEFHRMHEGRGDEESQPQLALEPSANGTSGHDGD